jgi:BatD DUF11 like domain
MRRCSALPLRRRLLWLVSALAFCALPVRGATFTASLDRNTITLGERATLSLTFEGGTPQKVPTPPAIPNLQISYVGPSTQFSFINGEVSSSVTHNFIIVPHQAGDYTIPALSAVVGGEKLTTQPLKLNVLKPGTTPPPPTPGNAGSPPQPAFLKLSLDKQKAHIGEVVVADLQFYRRRDVPLADQPHLTAFPAEGFSVGKPAVGNERLVQIGNVIYIAVQVRFALIPLKTGPLSVGPVGLNIALRQQSRDLFWDMLNGGQVKEYNLTSDTTGLQSLPLPAENVPPDFKGAVGRYALTVSAGPTNLPVGDPITVRIQISGRGALDSLTLPPQTAWRGFKSYPPTSTVTNTDDLGVEGTRTFEEVVVPQSADIKELPPFSFSYFDPDEQMYRTLSQPPIPLEVRSAGAAATPTIAAAGAAAQDDAPPAPDIVSIKQHLGELAEIGPPLAQRVWFLALQGFPVFALVSAAFWRRRAESLANNPRLRRQRQVAQVVRAGLNELQKLAAEKKSDEFFAVLFHLLQEQLGERLDLPASAITEAVIDEQLRPRGAPDAVLSPLQELFQTCNLARYAPVKTSQELAAMIPRLESALGEVRKLQL